MNGSRKVYLVIGIITITMLIMGVTTAWFTWNSTDNTDVSFNVEGLDITYTGDANVLNKKLYPTASMTNTDNVIHNFSLVTTSNIDIYTKISLDIIKLDDNLKDVSFRWNLYKEDISISSGNFSNATVGSDVLLTQTEMITTTPTNYTLYIWIDGENYSNPIAMGGKEFNFKLKLEAGQQDYTTSSESFAFDESTGTITDYYKNDRKVYQAEAGENCVDYFNGMQIEQYDYISQSEAETICSGGTVNNWYAKTLNNYISESDVNELTEAGVITNLTVATLKGGGTDVVIPSEINGVSVVSIGGLAFNYKGLTSVTIPDSVTTIGSSAFSNNNLTSITIPDSVTSIGNSAFADNLLTNLVIGNGVTTIGASAFHINNLSSVTIPNSVTTINNGAFEGNDITNIYIPDSVTSIDSTAFRSNPNLTSITVSPNNKVYDSRDNSNTIIETSSNKLIQGCKNTVIPNTVTSIGDAAFFGNGLTNITIPDSVTSIGNSAFQNNNLTSVIIPDSVTEIGYDAFSRNNLTNVIISNSVTSIKQSTFQNNNLTNITIPNNVNKILFGAFDNNKLTSVTIPESVTEIGGSAFANNNLTSIIIPDSVTEISSEAFENNNLTTVYIGKNSKLNNLYYNAFASSASSNPNLTTIYNLGGISLNWSLAIAGTYGTAFTNGTVTTEDGRTVTITTKE